MSTGFRTSGSFTEYGTTQKLALGTVMEDEFGSRYQYCYQAGADTAVVGQLACHFTTHSRGYISMTAATAVAETLGTVDKPAGMYLAAVPTVNYCWIQISGYTTLLQTDGGVVQGDFLVNDGGATPTFVCDTAVAGEEHGVIAYALADDVSTTVTAVLFCQ